MTELVRTRVKYVIGPDGSPLTITDLPPSNTRRWVIRRKAEVVAAVRGGLLSLDEACQRYTLTVEEFLSWQCSIDEHGLAGLRTTRIQQYRHWYAWPFLPWNINKTTVSFILRNGCFILRRIQECGIKIFPENEHMRKSGFKFQTLFRDSLPHFKKRFLQDVILKKITRFGKFNCCSTEIACSSDFLKI